MLAEHRFSRWPVLDPDTRDADRLLIDEGYDCANAADTAWTGLIRPLQVVGPHDSLEVTMQALQGDGANMAIVLDRGVAVGLITLEDILEEVVGKIEDEFPRLPRLYLKDALETGGIVLELAAQTPEEAIRYLAAAIPPNNLPGGVDVTKLALARERQMSTDIGHGMAIPVARCPDLAKPLIVLGRSDEGILFSTHSTEPARLIFLLVTPAERPNVQVFLLAQLTRAVGSEFIRERLYRAHSSQELIEIIAAADPEGRKRSRSLNKTSRLRVTTAGLTRAARDNLPRKPNAGRRIWQVLLPCFAIEWRLRQRE